jgi:hypothetical protein
MSGAAAWAGARGSVVVRNWFLFVFCTHVVLDSKVKINKQTYHWAWDASASQAPVVVARVPCHCRRGRCRCYLWLLTIYCDCVLFVVDMLMSDTIWAGEVEVWVEVEKVWKKNAFKHATPTWTPTLAKLGNWGIELGSSWGTSWRSSWATLKPPNAYPLQKDKISTYFASGRHWYYTSITRFQSWCYTVTSLQLQVEVARHWHYTSAHLCVGLDTNECSPQYKRQLDILPRH